MARTTTNYGWNISEGSDLVNPLTDIFPNFESLDTDLKEVSNASIGEATELKTGTVHTLTRTDTDKDVFKFTATSNFTAGDTFTVDNEQVSALTTSGEQLTTGCYIIGSEVLVAKKGTLLTFYISNVITDASTLEGHSASYFASASDLASTDADVLTLSNKVGTAILTTQAQDCSGAINELNTAGDYDELFSSENVISNRTITVQNINAYRYIGVGVCQRDDPKVIINLNMVPTELFKTLGEYQARYTGPSGNSIAHAKYVSDTSLNVYSDLNGIAVYGIK